VRSFNLSQDPGFAAKLRDVVGLYLDPAGPGGDVGIDWPRKPRDIAAT
jgi:hypothetical protein